jgi:RimJ/RimL family protein N-acetyltransferase
MLDKDSYVIKETLKNGTPITLRAARADDGPKIRRAFRNLERDTVYSRFFGYKSDVSDAELERITGADFDRDVALLVTIGSGDEEEVIAGASYVAIEEDSPARTAEIAFTVEEDYQGHGIASLLLRHIVRIARKKNLTRLQADVLARNLPMLAVFRRSGLPMTLQHEADVIHVALSLSEGTNVVP